ncbi:NAD(P)H-binding protein, partial [Nocardia sp. NPDC019302]|uniref:NAD(P)H-binding protein n=1 Tax=Nocardia sp. NPDC019302 TaxID=3154592 RepID=UPI0033E88671
MILVTGATGNVGRELLRELDAREAEFRALVRDPLRAAGLPERSQLVVADLDEPSTLRAAFADVEALFLLTPGVGVAPVRHAVDAAAAAGVRRIVHLSSANVLGDPMPAMGRWHHAREELVRASGIPATFLRPGGFTTNALEWITTLREGGYVLNPIGPGRHAPIDPADIAAVAAAVLTEEGHEGREYILTGPEVLTVPEQVEILARTLGRAIAVREVATAEEAVRARFPGGAPKVLADAIVESFAAMRNDTVGLRTDAVRQLIGRMPRSFADWVARNTEAFR